MSREQRDHDLAIAEARQVQESDVAERQRNMSQIQRDYEVNTIREQFRDTLLVNYIKDMTPPLMANEVTLKADPLVATIARAKILNAIRQLDASRKLRLMEFLYEAKQLQSNGQPLDLSDAELTDLNFIRGRKIHRNLCHRSLPGALLTNSSFSCRDLAYANFSEADLTDARFDKTLLNNADFPCVIIVRPSFSGAGFPLGRFDYVSSHQNFFSDVNPLDATFIRASLALSDFSTWVCWGADFFGAKLADANFNGAYVKRTSFREADISSETFNQIAFSQAIFYHASLSGAFFNGGSKNGDSKSVDWTRYNPQ